MYTFFSSRNHTDGGIDFNFNANRRNTSTEKRPNQKLHAMNRFYCKFSFNRIRLRLLYSLYDRSSSLIANRRFNLFSTQSQLLCAFRAFFSEFAQKNLGSEKQTISRCIWLRFHVLDSQSNSSMLRRILITVYVKKLWHLTVIRIFWNALKIEIQLLLSFGWSYGCTERSNV